jgi:large subunit ribosomal protein L25
MSERSGEVTATVRQHRGKGTSRKLRRAGQIPAVMYGAGGGNVMLAVSPAELRRAMDPERRLNTFFRVCVQEAGRPDLITPCIISDAQVDPIRDDLLHVDFLRVDPEQPVTMNVPVRYIGRSVGVMAGGHLQATRRSVRLAARPADMPVALDVDVTALNVGDALRLGDVPLHGARLVDPPSTVVAYVEEKKKATEPQPQSAEAPPEPPKP